MKDYFSFPPRVIFSFPLHALGRILEVGTELLFLPFSKMESGVGTHTRILRVHSQAILPVSSGVLHTP